MNFEEKTTEEILNVAIWLGFIFGKKAEIFIYKVAKRNFQLSLGITVITMISLYLPIFQLGN